MCNPSLHTEKSPLLGLQFIESSPFPTPQLNTITRRSHTTPTRRQQRQQEHLQNERRQLLYLMFLIAALLFAAPILCIIRESADRFFFGGRADNPFNDRHVLAQNTSPFLRQSSPSIVLSAREEELSTSPSSYPSLSPTTPHSQSNSTASSSWYVQIQTNILSPIELLDDTSTSVILSRTNTSQFTNNYAGGDGLTVLGYTKYWDFVM